VPYCRPILEPVNRVNVRVVQRADLRFATKARQAFRIVCAAVGQGFHLVHRGAIRRHPLVRHWFWGDGKLQKIGQAGRGTAHPGM
jgi:hypothetical protein